MRVQALVHGWMAKQQLLGVIRLTDLPSMRLYLWQEGQTSLYLHQLKAFTFELTYLIMCSTEAAKLKGELS